MHEPRYFSHICEHSAKCSFCEKSANDSNAVSLLPWFPDFSGFVTLFQGLC